MGLLDSTSHQEYYEGNDLGNYQFTSLDSIINQFEVAYVGENKIIPKIKRADIAFHAMRGLQELSFDTLKSVKTQQIDLPASLIMSLPHDYVNYTRIMWADSSGIKHPLYPTRDTQNPFQIRQNDDGSYVFPEEAEEVLNGDFGDATNFLHWARSPVQSHSQVTIAKVVGGGGKISFKHRTRNSHGANNWGHVMHITQVLDVSDKLSVDLSAEGIALDLTGGAGVLRVGLSTNPPDPNSKDIITGNYTRTYNVDPNYFNLFDVDGNRSYLEWRLGDVVAQEMTGIDVSSINTVYVTVFSFHEYTTSVTTIAETNSVDNISVVNTYATDKLTSPLGNETESSTWNNYKSSTPSENQDDYMDDTYWPAEGSRFGLDPQHAQVNGSFFIDQRLGRIHFSSNCSGKTVILDYISDSLGTDSEMQVHKFAEDAMYKFIAHAILSTSSYGQPLVPRLTKEKFAAIRKAKIRLSGLKLEELTQILRGKSKQIKH